ncbi:hypothetical protein IL306_006057 [Fusarium sp. DS 682]|nr:hypothetical protein IL306_006057 [Fusarium sp. DS 682]
MRGELCKIIYQATKEKAQYRFGTSIESFKNAGDKVNVKFSDGADESYDLLIAADGQGSRIRRKLFADDPDAIHKKLFGNIFKDAGWQAPRLIKAMHETEDFYTQSIVQIKTKTWSKGRVALLGDAGYAPSPLTGVGTTLALIGACVLSGEIARHANDIPRALKAYEDTLRPYVEKSQKLPPFVPGIAYPKTNFGIKLQYSIIGLVTKLKIDKAILAVLPEDRGTWRIPAYEGLKALEAGAMKQSPGRAGPQLYREQAFSDSRLANLGYPYTRLDSDSSLTIFIERDSLLMEQLSPIRYIKRQLSIRGIQTGTPPSPQSGVSLERDLTFQLVYSEASFR